MVCAVALSVAAAPWCLAADDDVTAENILDTLKRLDAAYGEGVTLGGTEVRPASRLAAGIPPRETRWKFSSFQGRMAVEFETVSAPPLDYVAPPAKSRKSRSLHGGYDHDSEGRLLLSIVQSTTTIMNKEVSAQSTTYSVMRVSPDNTATCSGQDTILQLCTPVAPTLTLPCKKALWSSGRGFGDCLYEVEKVEMLPDRQMRLVAKGWESSGATGRWELTLDLDAACMVRTAAFYTNSSEQPMYRITNKGLKREGDLCLPEEYVFEIGVETFQLTYTGKIESGKLEGDQEFVQKAEKIVEEPYPENTILIDERVSPPRTEVLDRRKK